MTTSDGGLHWLLGQAIGTVGDQNCHCFGAGQFAVFCQQNTRVYHTNDSWATFDSTEAISDTTIHFPQLSRCAWTDGDTIIAFGSGVNNSLNEGLILRSSNGGRSWAKSPLPVRVANGSIIAMSHPD